MPLVITRELPPPDGTDSRATVKYIVDILSKLYELIRGLVTLDENVRQQRTIAAERGVFFIGSSSAALISFETLIPDTITQDFTTALIQFDATSGAAHYRYDGGTPNALGLSTSGMPVPAGAFQIVLVGALNIRSFKIIGDAAATVNLSVTLHK